MAGKGATLNLPQERSNKKNATENGIDGAKGIRETKSRPKRVKNIRPPFKVLETGKDGGSKQPRPGGTTASHADDHR